MRDFIYITKADYEKLGRLIAGRRSSRLDVAHLHDLEQELERAEVIEEGQAVPADVITMNSRVRLRDLDSGEIREYRLVFPTEAQSDHAVSVLAPIGTAILGYRVGSVIQLQVPKGVRRLEVLEMLFQPEAASAEHQQVGAA